jgi:hypothetical protein
VATEPVKKSKRERAIAAAAERIGASPDELDAFTDALSRGNGRAAVGAGSRRTYIVPADAETPNLTEATAAPRTESRFWAEPLPGTDAQRARDTSG